MIRNGVINSYRRVLVEVRNAKRLETGFSMLEAVVVVGVLLALAIGGFFAYGSITDNAKKAAVKSAASQVYTSAMASNIDGDDSTKFDDVFTEYNKSNDKIKVELSGPAPTNGGDFCVQATNLQDQVITATFGGCSGVDGTPVNPGNGGGSSSPDNSAGTIVGGVYSPLLTTNINNHVIDASDLTYMNSFLSVFADPNSVDGWNGPGEFWDQENVNYWLNHESEPERVHDWENIYINLTATDPSFAAQKTAMDEAMTNWWNAPTVTEEMRKALYDTTFTVYKKMIASDQNEYRLTASALYPDDFKERTLAPGDLYPTMRVAIPTGVTGTVMGSQGIWTISNGGTISSPQPLNVITENGSQYIELSVGRSSFPGPQVVVYGYLIDDSGHHWYQQIVVNQ